MKNPFDRLPCGPDGAPLRRGGALLRRGGAFLDFPYSVPCQYPVSEIHCFILFPLPLCKEIKGDIKSLSVSLYERERSYSMKF